jgi:hypothetical protein
MEENQYSFAVQETAQFAQIESTKACINYLKHASLHGYLKQRPAKSSFPDNHAPYSSV